MQENKNTVVLDLLQQPKDFSDEAKFKQLQLNSLLQITEAINQNFKRSQLLNIYEFVLRRQLNIATFVLCTYSPEWEITLQYGLKEDFAFDFNLISQAESIGTEGLLDMFPLMHSQFDHIVPVYHKKQALSFTFFKFNADVPTQVQQSLIPFIQTISNVVMVALENKLLAKEAINQAGLKKELALAAQMQNMLFPAHLPQGEKKDIAALYFPFQEIGGDYYDYIKVSENEFYICMADVSGKGISAALLMSNLQASLQSLVKYCDNMPQIMAELNDAIILRAQGEKFITLFLAKINLETRTINYINAGHNPPMLASSKGLELLNIGTIGLGMFEKLPFVQEGKVQMEINETYRLVCYTDGVVELENDSGIEFGQNQLEDFIKEYPIALPSRAFLDDIIGKLHEYRENQSFHDDITLLSCKF